MEIFSNTNTTYFIIIVSAVTLLFFWYSNHYRKIERYYYGNNKNLFVLLEICILILMFSLVFNTKFIVFQFINVFYKKVLIKNK